MDEDANDHYEKNDSEDTDDIEVLVQREQAFTKQLRHILGLKENQYKNLKQELRRVIAELWALKSRQYASPCYCDPYILKQLRDMEEAIEEHFEEMGPQNPPCSDQSKQQKINELHQAYASQSPLKLLRTQNEISCHLQITYKNMMEGLNQELFQCMQERADLEDQQTEFDKKLKGLRQQIREVTERNQKLIKLIEHSKSGDG